MKDLAEQLADDGILLAQSMRAQGYSPARALATLCSAIIAICFLQERRDLMDLTVEQLSHTALKTLAKKHWEN